MYFIYLVHFYFLINIIFVFDKNIFLLVACFLNKNLKAIKINIHKNFNQEKMYIFNQNSLLNCFFFFHQHVFFIYENNSF